MHVLCVLNSVHVTLLSWCTDLLDGFLCTHHKVSWHLCLQVVCSWLRQYLPFNLLSNSSVKLLAEVSCK